MEDKKLIPHLIRLCSQSTKHLLMLKKVLVLTKVLNTREPIIQQEQLYKIHLQVLKMQNMESPFHLV